MIQHEMDHLDGVLILDRTSRDQRKQAMRTLREEGAGTRRSASARRPTPAMRTVYLGTSSFAAAVLERLAASAAPAGARRHAPRRAARAAGAGSRRRRSPMRRASSGIELIQPERLHDAEVLERIAAAEPDALVVCAYGALIKEPLLSRLRDPQRPPVAAAALARRGAGRAGDHGRRRGDRRLDHAPDRGARLRAGLPAGARADPARRRLRHAGRAPARRSAASCSCARSTSGPPFVEQDEEGVTYAHKIEARDRALDPTRPPEEVERAVRALRPHIGARLPLPDGAFLGVLAAAVDGETLAPAGGRVRADGDRLLLDCNGGALELIEVQPPGGRRWPRRDWLRGRPDPALTDFWLDPRLPGPLARGAGRARRPRVALRRRVGAVPGGAGLARRRGRARRARAMAADDDPRARGVAAYVLGQLGMPVRTFPAESAAALRGDGRARAGPGVLATIASGFGHLGAPYGIETLLRSPPPRRARARGGGDALAGRDDERVFDALVQLSRDAEPDIRDWATFALGTLAAAGHAELRDALAARLGDPDRDAPRGRPRAGAARRRARARAGLDLLGEAAHDDGGMWRRMELRETAQRLAAQTGDERFEPYLPG